MSSGAQLEWENGISAYRSCRASEAAKPGKAAKLTQRIGEFSALLVALDRYGLPLPAGFAPEQSGPEGDDATNEESN